MRSATVLNIRKFHTPVLETPRSETVSLDNNITALYWRVNTLANTSIYIYRCMLFDREINISAFSPQVIIFH